MEFGVLGPLRAVESGVDRAPTAPKQRQMLALLLLNANRVVSRAQLVEELWEYSPPSSAVAAVHTYVMQLRRALPGGSGERDGDRPNRLITREQGYLLQVRPGELDLEVYEDRVHVARDTLSRTHTSEASRQLHEAEDMWRGQLLVDVTTGPLLHAAMEVIERNRLDAITQRIRADLQLGRHHELLGELSALAHQHPTHEDLAGHLMLALYRSGRQADALDAFHHLRLTLRAELDASPSRRIQRLHDDILSAHPRLELPFDTRCPLSLYLFTGSSGVDTQHQGKSAVLLRT